MNRFESIVTGVVVVVIAIAIIWFSIFMRKNVTEPFLYKRFTEKSVEKTVNRILLEKGLIINEGGK